MAKTQPTGSQIADQTVKLDTPNQDVTGVLPVANGGTGATSQTLNNVLLGNGTGALQNVAPGSNGNGLVSNGTTWTATPVAQASGFLKITVSATQPSSPATGDLWVDTN